MIRVLSFGAGVQSTTLLRMILAGDLPAVDHVVFADTGWEMPGVLEHVETMKQLTEAAGVPFHVVRNGNLREDMVSGRRFASVPLHIYNQAGQKAMGRRQCTHEYKLVPIQRKVRELAGVAPRKRPKGVLVEQVIGISWDESHRMRDPYKPWQVNDYPLVTARMTRADCIKWNEANGFGRPPRSSCIGCPYHSQDEWRHVKSIPEAWQDACEVDDALRSEELRHKFFDGRAYLHPKRIPLRQVDLRTPEEQGQGTLWEGECEGMCGL